jgi:hypothetical protein
MAAEERGHEIAFAAEPAATHRFWFTQAFVHREVALRAAPIQRVCNLGQG